MSEHCDALHKKVLKIGYKNNYTVTVSFYESGHGTFTPPLNKLCCEITLLGFE